MDALNALRGISNQYNKIAAGSAASEVRDNSFATIFQSAKDMLEETSNLQNKAEEQEIKFALGLSNNTHDLQIAQEKANIALQYTIAVRDKVIEAYKELMNISVWEGFNLLYHREWLSCLRKLKRFWTKL